LKVICTGAAGFIGSHLVDALLAQDYEVIGIDNFSKGTENNIKHIKSDKFQLIAKDIKTLPDSIFEGVDAIFHIASNADTFKSIEDSSFDLNETFLSTFYMLEIARVNKIKNFIFSSSSTVYGDHGNMSLLESSGPLLPLSHYGAAKLASEAFISSFAENYGMHTLIIRFPNVIGPRMTHGALWNFIRQLKENPKKLEVLGDGSQCKPYIHVKDLIDAIIFLWFNSAKKVNVFNVAPYDKSKTKLKDMAEWVAKEFNCNNIQYGANPTGYVGDINTFSFNVDKLQKLGFIVDRSSDDAVRKTIKECINDNRTSKNKQ